MSSHLLTVCLITFDFMFFWTGSHRILIGSKLKFYLEMFLSAHHHHHFLLLLLLLGSINTRVSLRQRCQWLLLHLYNIQFYPRLIKVVISNRMSLLSEFCLFSCVSRNNNRSSRFYYFSIWLIPFSLFSQLVIDKLETKKHD